MDKAEYIFYKYAQRQQSTNPNDMANHPIQPIYQEQPKLEQAPTTSTPPTQTTTVNTAPTTTTTKPVTKTQQPKTSSLSEKLKGIRAYFHQQNPTLITQHGLYARAYYNTVVTPREKEWKANK